MKRLVVALCLCALLAGCVGADRPAGPSPVTSTTPAVEFRLDRPNCLTSAGGPCTEPLTYPRLPATVDADRALAFAKEYEATRRWNDAVNGSDGITEFRTAFESASVVERADGYVVRLEGQYGFVVEDGEDGLVAGEGPLAVAYFLNGTVAVRAAGPTAGGSADASDVREAGTVVATR